MNVCLSIVLFREQVACNLRLPTVTVSEQFLLIVEQLLVRLSGELEIRSLHDRVNGTRLLTETTVDTCMHTYTQ